MQWCQVRDGCTRAQRSQGDGVVERRIWKYSVCWDAKEVKVLGKVCCAQHEGGLTRKVMCSFGNSTENFVEKCPIFIYFVL